MGEWVIMLFLRRGHVVLVPLEVPIAVRYSQLASVVRSNPVSENRTPCLLANPEIKHVHRLARL